MGSTSTACNVAAGYVDVDTAFLVSLLMIVLAPYLDSPSGDADLANVFTGFARSSSEFD